MQDRFSIMCRADVCPRQRTRCFACKNGFARLDGIKISRKLTRNDWFWIGFVAVVNSATLFSLLEFFPMADARFHGHRPYESGRKRKWWWSEQLIEKMGYDKSRNPSICSICKGCARYKPSNFGRGERIRTSDHLHPMQVRYQAALRPEAANYISAGTRFRAALRAQQICNIGKFFAQHAWHHGGLGAAGSTGTVAVGGGRTRII